jgi:hypothetical protein
MVLAIPALSYTVFNHLTGNRLIKIYKRREQGTGNREQGTGNREQGTGKKQKLHQFKAQLKKRCFLRCVARKKTVSLFQSHVFKHEFFLLESCPFPVPSELIFELNIGHRYNTQEFDYPLISSRF